MFSENLLCNLIKRGGGSKAVYKLFKKTGKLVSGGFPYLSVGHVMSCHHSHQVSQRSQVRSLRMFSERLCLCLLSLFYLIFVIFLDRQNLG